MKGPVGNEVGRVRYQEMRVVGETNISEDSRPGS